MKELLKTYKETLSEIFTRFDMKIGYGELDIKTDVEWLQIERDLYWVEGEDKELYSNEIYGAKKVAEGLTIFYVDNGCGDRFYQIFNNELMNENLDIN